MCTPYEAAAAAGHLKCVQAMTELVEQLSPKNIQLTFQLTGLAHQDLGWDAGQRLVAGRTLCEGTFVASGENQAALGPPKPISLPREGYELGHRATAIDLSRQVDGCDGGRSLSAADLAVLCSWVKTHGTITCLNLSDCGLSPNKLAWLDRGVAECPLKSLLDTFRLFVFDFDVIRIASISVFTYVRRWFSRRS